MIPVPTLPTDNLYKFAALSGVAIFIVGALLPSIDDKEMTSRMIDLMTKSAVAQENMKIYKAQSEDLDQIGRTLDRHIEQVSQRADRLKNDPSRSNHLESGIDDLIKERDALSAKKAAFMANFTTFRLEMARITGDVAVMDRFFVVRTRMSYFGFGLSALGVLIAYVGFKLWYSRIQVHLDLAIKNETAKEKAPG